MGKFLVEFMTSLSSWRIRNPPGYQNTGLYCFCCEVVVYDHKLNLLCDFELSSVN
jgi:hypothetical protein